MSNLPVDRCVCANVTFAEMQSHLAREGGDIDSLRRMLGCGGGCAMCVPYIRAMLATGRVRFAVDDAALRAAETNAPSTAPPPPAPLPPPPPL